MNSRYYGLGRAKKGFSLVEVTLSLAIVSFAFTTLLALMSLGLQVFRGSIATTITAQIIQQVVTKAQETEFSALGTLASSSSSTPIYYYYNSDGVQAPAANSIYTAAVSYNAGTLPGSANTGLVNLRIVVYDNKGNFVGGVPQDTNPTIYCVHLANFGQRL